MTKVEEKDYYSTSKRGAKDSPKLKADIMKARKSMGSNLRDQDRAEIGVRAAAEDKKSKKKEK